MHLYPLHYGATAAKSLQSCPTAQPHGQQPIRLPRPWDSPGKNTGAVCHFFLQCMKVKSESEVAQSCPTLSDPVCGLQPTRLPRPWDFPGKSNGVGCHCLLRHFGELLPIGKKNTTVGNWKTTRIGCSQNKK